MDEFRTHTCGSLCKNSIGTIVFLAGWVNRRRDHGGLVFIDLRDRFGITQLVFDPKMNLETHAQACALRSEWVISVEGKVVQRSEGMSNPNLATGDIEIEVYRLEVFSKAKTPPFSICDEFIDVNEELRLKYRYLDIRRGEICNSLIMRHKAMLVARNYLDEQGFLEINTPILGKSTPEGARDYLVPSRIYPGQFYALPQSPQLFKQILMIAGMDKYFQIASCFRDEDLRSDRQPEFTQIDIEMSFSTYKKLFPLLESLLKNIFKACIDIEIKVPFKQLTYDTCIEKYGTDKPDLRFGMELFCLNDIARQSSFSVFIDQLNKGGVVKGFCVKGGADISRRVIDEYTNFVSYFGIKGLAWMKRQGNTLTSSIVKFFPEDIQKLLIDTMCIDEGDLIFIIADKVDKTNQALDHLRRKIARDRQLTHPLQYEFLWVTDYPLFLQDPDTGDMESAHNPFTAPHIEDMHLLDTDPLSMRASSYDIVLNGYELGSGSQRIHDSELQHKIFNILQLTEKDIKDKFGFFVESLQYGTPPHLGIALGFDRLMMILGKTENIRDVIAFPKTQKASDLMTNAPSSVEKKQLNDLGISI